MPDAVKVGFVPFSAAPRGILVVFCDDSLKFGEATRKALGEAADLVARAAATNQFKGKSGATLDILAPAGLKAPRLIVVGAGKLSGLRLLQARRRRRREACCRQGARDDRGRLAGWPDEARTGGRARLGGAASRL